MKDFVISFLCIIGLGLLGAMSSPNQTQAQNNDTVAAPLPKDLLPAGFAEQQEKIKRLKAERDSLANSLSERAATKVIEPEVQTSVAVTVQNMDKDYRAVMQALRKVRNLPVTFKARQIPPISNVKPIPVDSLKTPAIVLPEKDEPGIFKQIFNWMFFK